MELIILGVVIIILSVLLVKSLLATRRFRFKLEEYKKQDNSLGLNAKQIIEVLNERLQEFCQVEVGKKDAYYIGKKQIKLTQYIMSAKSISSMAVTLHEYGHFIGDKNTYKRFVYLIAKIAIYIPFILLIFFPYYITVVIAMLSTIVGSLLVSVEENAANKNVKKVLLPILEINDEEQSKVMEVLKYAKKTYSAAFIIEILFIAYIAFTL